MSKEYEISKLQRFMAVTGQPKITAQAILSSASSDLQKALTAAASTEEFATASKAIVGEYYKATDATEEPTEEPTDQPTEEPTEEPEVEEPQVPERPGGGNSDQLT